jgi:hypothetical protein
MASSVSLEMRWAPHLPSRPRNIRYRCATVDEEVFTLYLEKMGESAQKLDELMMIYEDIDNSLPGQGKEMLRGTVQNAMRLASKLKASPMHHLTLGAIGRWLKQQNIDLDKTQEGLDKFDAELREFEVRHMRGKVWGYESLTLPESVYMLHCEQEEATSAAAALEAQMQAATGASAGGLTNLETPQLLGAEGSATGSGRAEQESQTDPYAEDVDVRSAKKGTKESAESAVRKMAGTSNNSKEKGSTPESSAKAALYSGAGQHSMTCTVLDLHLTECIMRQDQASRTALAALADNLCTRVWSLLQRYRVFTSACCCSYKPDCKPYR